MTYVVSLISVAAGGAIGASLRFSVSIWLGSMSKFPFPTLFVNVVGCFLAGVVFATLLAKAPTSNNVQLLLITGVLGGFTTFSAFSLDTLRLFEADQAGLAAINVVANMLGSLVAVAGGWWLARGVLL